MLKRLFFALILLISAKGFGIKISLSPQEIMLTAFPGTTRGFSFTLNNYGKKEAYCKIYTKDLDITPDGEILFLPTGSLTYSCAKWIEFKETSFTIKPEEAKKVSGYVSVPRDKNINGSYDAIILCEFPPPAPSLKEDVAGVGINLKLSLHIEVEVGRPKEKLEIGKIEFLPEGKRFTVRVDNRGESSCLTEKGSLLIKRMGAIVETIPLTSNRYTLLRNSSRMFYGGFNKILPKGMYRVEAIIGYDEKYKVIGKNSIFIDKDGRITFLKEEEKEEKGILFEINPGFVFISLPQRGFRADVIKVVNKEEEPILVFCEQRNTSYKKSELQILPPSSETAYSITPFIELFPTSLRLAPKQSGIIRYKVIVPEEKRGGRYGTLLFTLSTLYGKKRDSFQLPLHLVILKTQESKIEVDKVKVSREEVSLILKNEGNILEEAKSANLLIKHEGKIVARVKFVTPFLFPKESEEVKIEIPELPRLDYRFQIEIEGRIIEL